jgi:serine/threonine protein kinase
MLNRRGNEPDVVKVLDFGLVKAVDTGRQSEQSAGLAGTPLYMSPEAIQTPDFVDGRTDLYALGAVAYFLITGKPVFSASTLVELCQSQVEVVPETPSDRLGRPISAELEGAIMACLEKSRSKRPQTARELATLLDQCPTANSWSLSEAEAWWGRHERAQPAGGDGTTLGSDGLPHSSPATGSGSGPSTNAPPSRTSTSGFDQTIAHPPS